MFIGLILGFAAGVIFLTMYNVYQEEKRFEEELAEIFDEMVEETNETFTYDCLNDPEPDNNHVSKIY